MSDNIVCSFRPTEDAAPQRSASVRQYVRYEGDIAEVMINGRSHALMNWSLGGIAFKNATSQFPGDIVPFAGLKTDNVAYMALRFYMLSEVIEIPVTARIVRIGDGYTAAQFMPLSPEARQQFDHVLELKNKKDFARTKACND